MTGRGPDPEDGVEAGGDPIADAAAAALRGALIVFPTDTVYGIATRPDDPAATGRLFEAKGRPTDLALPVLVPTVGAARTVAVLDARAEKLAGVFWPGGLTMVLRRTEAAGSWELGGDGMTVGIRVPRHPLALALLGLTGPLAVTSANRSGDPPAGTCAELEAAFGDLVEIYLCGESELSGEASTVIDLAGERPQILREGGLDPEALRRSLA